MKLKTIDISGKTYAEVADNKPLYAGDDGKDIAFDAPHSVSTIKRLNGEAQGHRERAEAAESKLKGFEGIEDAEAARAAIETVKNLKDGDLVTAGKVEEIKTAAKKAAEDQVAAAAKASNEQIKALTGERDGLQNDLFTEKVGGAFSRSEYIKKNLIVPADMVQDKFGKRFKVENGKIIGVGADNQPIYSRSKAGEIADFDEALESMINGYEQRDQILSSSGNIGDKAPHNQNTRNGPDLSGLSPAARITAARAAGAAKR